MYRVVHQVAYYRVSHALVDLGWVDLDLGSSPGWWAATVATYCPSRASQQNPVHEEMGRPVPFVDICHSTASFY